MILMPFGIHQPCTVIRLFCKKLFTVNTVLLMLLLVCFGSNLTFSVCISISCCKCRKCKCQIVILHFEPFWPFERERAKMFPRAPRSRTGTVKYGSVGFEARRVHSIFSPARARSSTVYAITPWESSCNLTVTIAARVSSMYL